MTELDWRKRLELTAGRYQMMALERGLRLAAGLEPRTIAVGELDLAVLERKRPGVPVMLIHGFGGDKETWLLMAPRLRGCPMVLLDLPGHGASTVVGRDAASPAAMGRNVVAALDALGHERVHLVGNSMGGGIALWVARHHAARIASLTLVASVAPELAESELTRALARGENLLIPGGDDPDKFIKLVVEKPPRVPRAIKRYVAARRAAARPVLEELFRGWAFAAPEHGLPPDLEAIEHSTLIIHGARDRIIHPDTARKVVKRLPRARLEVLEGIGHVPQLEAPGVVARLIHRHLQEQR